MKVVQTIRGLIPRDQLQVSVEMTETENALVVATVWRLIAEGPDGQHVKRDAHAIMLATPEMQSQFSNFQGTMVIAAPPGVGSPDVTVGLNGQQMGVEQSKLS